MKLVLVTLLFLILPQAYAQNMLVEIENVHPVAKQAMITLDKLTNEQNNQVMGFENLEEVNKIKLGAPIQIFNIRLDELLKYDSDNDPAMILSGGQNYIYPVMIGNEVRTSIELDKIQNEWQATKFGGTNSIKLLTKIRSQIEDTTGLDITAFFSVTIPSLNLYFIAHKIDGKLFLTPILDDYGFNIKAGIPMSAKSVLESILPVARKHDGEPG